MRVLPAPPPDAHGVAESLYCAASPSLDPLGEEALEQLCGHHPEHGADIRRVHADLLAARTALHAFDLALAGGDSDADPDADTDLSAEPARQPLTIRGEIGCGGMGRVLEAYDEDLRRRVAMKVARAPNHPHVGAATLVLERRQCRLLAEAQIVAQLTHPGVPPLHEVGKDAQGQPFFTMLLVEGSSFGSAIEAMLDGRGPWTLVNLIGALRRAAETVAYAHARGVVHRDLKPDNVMLGVEGQVYVMDWGLARAQGTGRTADLPLPAPGLPGAGDNPWSAPSGINGSVHTTRRDLRDDHPSSPLLTRAGDVIGTPGYMAPEQARGDPDAVDARADVFGLGAMLYHTLAGFGPYRDERGVEPEAAGGPTPLYRVARRAPDELIAVAEKAMATDPSARYPSALAFADDLGAWLEGRSVAAHRTGAWSELRRWGRRNRALALVLATAVLLAAVATVATLWLQAQSYRDLLTTNADLARVDADAKRSMQEATARERDLRSLADARILRGLLAAAAELGAAVPERRAAFVAWLSRAEALAGRLGQHESRLAALRDEALPQAIDPGEVERRRVRELDELATLRAQRRSLRDGARRAELDRAADIDARWRAVEEMTATIEERQAALSPPAAWRFADGAQQWQHDAASELVDALRAFDAPDGELARVRQRLAREVALDAGAQADPKWGRRWQEAVASIADPRQCPAYRGLRIVPQRGLLPIGKDPASGLWELAHLPSGTAAERDPDSGRLRLAAENGLVLVLLPGGTCTLGRQRDDPTAPRFVPTAAVRDKPLNDVHLRPFFLSKYEMTQAQWLRATGTNPSQITPERNDYSIEAITLLHPVGFLTWFDCDRVTKELDLGLPTEAQWEYAARAGTATIWYTGDDRSSLEGHANLADRTWARLIGGATASESWDDGFAVTAPVGSLKPNPFGLHDMSGNAAEWCADPLCDYHCAARDGDGFRAAPFPMTCCRDSWPWAIAEEVSSGCREGHRRSHRFIASGVRPALELRP